MKRLGLFVFVAILVLGLSIFLAACGGGGGGSSPATSSSSSSGGSSSSSSSSSGGGITTISTSTQGAQSAAATVTTSRNIANTSIQLSGMAAMGGSNPPAAARLKVFAGTKATALSKFAARFAPMVRRANAMKASATGYPMTVSCASGATGTVAPLSNNSMTIDVDTTGNMTLTFTQCKEASTLTDGVFAIVGAANSGTFTLGSTGRPFTVTDYSSSAPTTAVSKSVVSMTMAFSSSGTGETISANGTLEGWDYVLHTHEAQTMTNLSIGVASTTTTINSASYNVDTLTLSGSGGDTTYASDTDSTVSYSETDSFANFSIAYKTPSGTTGNDYFSINGSFTIATTPADQCIDGTFSITTNTDIQIDANGVTQAGQVTIDSNVVVIFQANGAATVSINGGAPQAYTGSELDSLCAL